MPAAEIDLESLTPKILELYAIGHGKDAISLKLKIPGRIVIKVLKIHGLRRTAQEARRLRLANGLYGVYGVGHEVRVTKYYDSK